MKNTRYSEAGFVLAAALSVGLVAPWPPGPAAIPMSEAGEVTQTPAEAAFEDGSKALQAGDLTAAFESFTRARQRDPQSVQPLLGLAEIARRQSKPDEVEKQLRLAVEIGPTSGPAHFAWGQFLYSRGDAAGARRALQQASELAPGAEGPKIALGVLFSQSIGDHNIAIGYFQDALRINPNHAGARYALGTAFDKVGLKDDAIKELEEAARLDPTNPLPHDGLGRVYADRREHDKALKSFATAVAISPGFVIGHVAQGDIFARTGRAADAIASYHKALETDPKYVPAQTRLGMMYQAARDWGKAEEMYLKTLALAPDDAVALNNLAMMAIDSEGDLNRGLAWAAKAAKLHPENPEILDTLAWVHRARGDMKQAQTILEKAAAVASSSPTVQYHLGLVLLERGMDKQAMRQFQKALLMPQNFPEADIARELVGEFVP